MEQNITAKYLCWNFNDLFNWIKILLFNYLLINNIISSSLLGQIKQLHGPIWLLGCSLITPAYFKTADTGSECSQSERVMVIILLLCQIIWRQKAEPWCSDQSKWCWMVRDSTLKPCNVLSLTWQMWSQVMKQSFNLSDRLLKYWWSFTWSNLSSWFVMWNSRQVFIPPLLSFVFSKPWCRNVSLFYASETKTAGLTLKKSCLSLFCFNLFRITTGIWILRKSKGNGKNIL